MYFVILLASMALTYISIAISAKFSIILTEAVIIIIYCMFVIININILEHLLRRRIAYVITHILYGTAIRAKIADIKVIARRFARTMSYDTFMTCRPSDDRFNMIRQKIYGDVTEYVAVGDDILFFWNGDINYPNIYPVMYQKEFRCLLQEKEDQDLVKFADAVVNPALGEDYFLFANFLDENGRLLNWLELWPARHL
ncbi:Hypothetical protein BN69_1140 [Methylocystis sp. SC2]|nr:Hypothetical protein BN69_1140 [Methylocystis sp. SC2]